MSRVLLMVCVEQDRVKKSVWSTVSFVKQLCQKRGYTFDVLAVGVKISDSLVELKTLGATKVLVASSPGFEGFFAENITPILKQTVLDNSYEFIVSSESTVENDTLARLSGQLDAGMASGVTALESDGDTLTFCRPMYAGNVNGTVQIETELKVITVRPAEFDSAQPDGESTVSLLEIIEPEKCSGQLELIESVSQDSERPPLEEAKVVVGGGLGFKSREDFSLVEKLADTFNGAVGASRAAIDAGYISNDFQIGQTGKMISPDIYFALGISGALQHMAGVKSAKTVIAINKDPDAPVFNYADYGLKGDLYTHLPELIKLLKEMK